MDKFLVITKYNDASSEANAAKGFFKHWKNQVVSENPYAVIISAHSIRELTDELNVSDIECTVTQLGRTVHRHAAA